MKFFLYSLVFFIFTLGSQQALALTSGTTTTGSIVAGGTSPQSLSGNAGQVIVLNATASYDVVIKVLNPDGSVLGTQTNRFSANLPTTGNYSVVISATTASASGSYTLYYFKGGDGVSNGSLAIAQPYSGFLSTNQMVSFQLAGTAS